MINRNICLHFAREQAETDELKTCLHHGAKNKVADQLPHLRSLISTNVFRCLDCIIPTHMPAKPKISRH